MDPGDTATRREYLSEAVPELDGETFFGPGPLGPPYTFRDLQNLAEMGANYVNISHPGLFTESPPYVVDPDVQANLDTLLSWISKSNLFAVISFRTGPGRSEFTFVLEDVGDWFDASYLNDSVWQDQTAQQGWIDMWQFTRKLSLEVYGIGRIGRDVNRDFWNNRAEKGIGMRIRFSHKVFLALYSDWIQGQ